ncbi:S-adenosyl-L-methionine-dependent methyltransferase [Plenodomus tracheiphilus IPT5]|uniref:DNA (cytosine-5-)-methyltransferase n=1 Tax=Plenodomus tracheiphilus IPT5 TaxID=1408161 RepID=A0A6A7B6R1_9PLEO|nr:S-adenosyl-L-methionine-dependent methyltransferase [Plenodomus tracheiphilus IPT5]
MPLNRPYIVDDDDDSGGGVFNVDDSDVELLDYDSDCSEPEIISVRDRTLTSVLSKTSCHSTVGAKQTISLPDVEIPLSKLTNGKTVKPGDTLELQDHTTQGSNAMHSGDFLHVKTIIQNLETDEVRFRGHRMRRTKYLGQIFDWKLNELCMVLHVEEGDPRCPFIAGLEDVASEQVLRVRDCTLTNKPYPQLSFRDGSYCAYPTNMSEAEIRRQVYHGGRLTCRVVSVLFMHAKVKNAKKTQTPRSGIVRHLYAHETSAPDISSRTSNLGSSRETSITVEDNDEDDVIIVSNRKRRSRSDSIEMLNESPPKRSLPNPFRGNRYTFADVFCGVGGASQGAAQADLYVSWGLDADQLALQAYRMNHRGASAFLSNAHDFPPPGKTTQDLRVDVLHLSPPCCFFSPAHTVEGPNDQANYEAIYTVGPIITMVKPRVATLEQTFGLVSRTQHMKNFYMLLNDIGKAGYDIRYEIQDLSRHGLVQKRKRLLIIAARRGTPLPPFPEESHGPRGSGLKPLVCMDDVLQPITRMGRRASLNDPYHQPKPARHPREPTNPHDSLRGCITTGGSNSYHYSGQRKWTARELSLFQSFPYDYKFTGSKTKATKQVGNAFPPVMAEAMYHTIIKTLEAFDSGVISAEEDISDLDEVLRRKGANTPSQPHPEADCSLFNPSTRSTLPLRQSRGLVSASSLAPFGLNSTTPQLAAPRGERRHLASFTNFFSNGNSIGPHSSTPDQPRQASRNDRERSIGAMDDNDIIELSD